MSRPESRFIEKLTKFQVERLEHSRDYDTSKRVRQRAHAVLLSFRGTSVNELVEIFSTSRNTICNWLDRWEAKKLSGLADQQRPGAPPKLTLKEQVLALNLVKKTPRSSNTVLVELEKQTGKKISSSTLKRLLKRSKLIWKRMRKSLRKKRDQKKFTT